MGYYTKVKKDFSFRKIKFKGIDCYEGDGTKINVTVTGTAQMIRQILKSEYPKYSAQGTWVKTRKFANGDAIDVELNRFPQDIYKAIKADLEVFDSYAVNHQNAKRTEIKTDDGLPIEAYTKYLHIDNVPPYGSKEKNEPAPDWEKILKDSPKQKTTTSNDTGKWSKGDLLKECAGWKVYKKTLPTGKIVYSAFKDKETAPNKTDWNTIKSEVYMQSGFKYGRFGNFERWGSMTDNDENLNINALCEVLTKYYSSNTPATPEPESNESVDVYINGEFYKQFKNKDESIWSMGAKYGGTKWNELIANGKAIFSGNVWQINEKEETNSKQDEPQTEPFNINDSYKKLPANPKLEYCKIKYAEGLIDYADTFPKTFQSFTALTKYIADNIGEIPTQGYDKHGIEWKWKFEDSIGSSRWDVSENGANPVKYPNLYAGEKLRMLCYNAWAKLDSGGVTDDALKNIDEFYGTLVGKEGFELNTDQFNTILTDYLTYYKKDDDKRFLYITPEDRLKRFKDVYPRLIAAFEEKVDDKEEIIATIEALQYLADAGDDEAKTTIEALQYLI